MPPSSAPGVELRAHGDRKRFGCGASVFSTMPNALGSSR